MKNKPLDPATGFGVLLILFAMLTAIPAGFSVGTFHIIAAIAAVLGVVLVIVGTITSKDKPHD